MNNNRRIFVYLIWWLITIFFLISIFYCAIYLYIYESITLPIISLIVIYFLNIICASIIFASNRESYSKLSWFILVVIFPVIGSVFFLIFGSRFARRMTYKKYHQQYKKYGIKFQESNWENIHRYEKNILLPISKSVQRPILPSDITLLFSSGEALQSMFNELRNAKKFIHAHCYLFKQGEIFEEFKTILIQKAKEGVEIRLIIDDFGRWALPWYQIKSLEEANINVAIWAKVAFPFISGENGYRTHRKIIIIDGETLFTGGANITDEYAHLSKKYGYWYDIQIMATGAAIHSYSLLFISDWNFMTNELISIKKYAPIQKNEGSSHMIMVESGPDNIESQSLDTLVKLIISANKYIYLTTPYFVPDDNIMTALRIASNSGVKIKIIIPGIYDKKNVKLVTNYFAKTAQIMGIEFYTINDSFMHSKCGVFDGKIAYSGTLNLDIRSFYQQFEVMNVMYGKIVDDFSTLFDSYFKYSEKINFSPYGKMKLFHKIYTIIVRIFSPLM